MSWRRCREKWVMATGRYIEQRKGSAAASVRRRCRSRHLGRPPSEQVSTAARIARSLRSLGLLLTEIARTDIMVRFLGTIVSEARISQLLHRQAREPGWARDTRFVSDHWCRPPMAREFYHNVVFPLLLVRSEMDDPVSKRRYGVGRRDSDQGFTSQTFQEVSEEEWVERHREYKEVAGLATLPDPAPMGVRRTSADHAPPPCGAGRLEARPGAAFQAQHPAGRAHPARRPPWRVGSPRTRELALPSEADTRRQFVVPKLQAAGWDTEPCSIAEQRTVTDGRIVPRGQGFIRKPPKRVDYLLRLRRDFPLAVVEAKAAYKKGRRWPPASERLRGDAGAQVRLRHERPRSHRSRLLHRPGDITFGLIPIAGPGIVIADSTAGRIGAPKPAPKPDPTRRSRYRAGVCRRQGNIRTLLLAQCVVGWHWQLCSWRSRARSVWGGGAHWSLASLGRFIPRSWRSTFSWY